MTVGGDDSGPWLMVKVHIENRNTQDLSGPDIGIVCADGPEPGGYQADSTFRIGDKVPARSYLDGTLNLLLPGDSRTDAVVHACDTPAFVQAQATSSTSDRPTVVRTAVPDRVIAELNAKRHSR